MRGTSARRRILLVDDEELFVKSLALLLREQGYRCEIATTTAAADALLDAREFDLVIADIFMKGNVELEFVERLRARRPRPVVLLMTGNPSFESAVRAVDIGVAGYLLKPIESEELLRRVDECLEQAAVENVVHRTREYLRDIRADLALEEPAGSPLRQPPVGATGAPPAHGDEAWRRLLTRRECEVLEQLLEGYRVATVARRLAISPHTVRRHLKSIFLKLEVRSQAELLEKLKPDGAGGGV